MRADLGIASGITRQLFLEHNEVPFPNSESQVATRSLNRYRAAAKMSLPRALNTLRELQTIRPGRIVHLTKSEIEAIDPLASSKVFGHRLHAKESPLS